jgi:hypothetical protein
MTPEEAALGSSLSKLALNVCLMASAYGIRCLGPANPSYHERLKRYAKLARKRGREQQERAEMKTIGLPGTLRPSCKAVPNRECGSRSGGSLAWAATEGRWAWYSPTAQPSPRNRNSRAQ